MTETLALSWGRAEAGVSVPVLRVSGVSVAGEVALQVEGLPRFIAFGDLNGDWIRDVLLALVDESTLLPQVVLLGPEGPRNASSDEGVNWREVQFRHDDQAPAGCVDRMLPVVRSLPSEGIVIEVYSGVSWTGGCENPSITRLVVEGDTLRLSP